jgi:hypothetical protein
VGKLGEDCSVIEKLAGLFIRNLVKLANLAPERQKSSLLPYLIKALPPAEQEAVPAQRRQESPRFGRTPLPPL